MYVRIIAIVLIIVQSFLPSQPTAAAAPVWSPAAPRSAPESLADAPAAAFSTQSPPTTVTEDSLQRPAITYNNRQQTRYKHADIAISDHSELSHFVYTRQEGTRYKVYYQQRPYLDYDLHPSAEVELGSAEITSFSPDSFQYPRIATDVRGGVHVIWVIRDTLYYRYCNAELAGDCTSASQWGAEITWTGPTADCPLYHPSIITWTSPSDQDGITHIAISFFVAGTSNKVTVLKKDLGDAQFASTVIDTVNDYGATPAIAASTNTDQVHVIYRKPDSGLMYRVLEHNYQLGPAQVLVGESDPATAPLNLADSVYAANFISTYGIKATFGRVYIAYPSTSQRLMFIACGTTCSNATPSVTDLSTTLNATVFHDVRVLLTKSGQPALLWKQKTNNTDAIKVAVAHNGTWGASQTLYTSSSYVANLAGAIDDHAATHIGWTEMEGVPTDDYPSSSDHYFQQVQEPIIFIPGTMGSTLYDADGQQEIFPYDGLIDWGRLTMDPQDEDRFQNIIGGRILKLEYAGNLFNELHDNGYVEYHVNNLNARRTAIGCDMSQRQARPNLFPFAYDWRRETDIAVEGLHEYLACINRFYPSFKVNLLGHSLGTLIGRKYIVRYGANHVRTLTTMGGPWWGAPATLQAYLGNYIGVIPDSIEERINRTFPSLAEMSASERYFLTGPSPVSEFEVDWNGDGIRRGPLNYNQYTMGMDLRFNPNFSWLNQNTHERPGIDTWDPILEEVEFHNIYTNFDGETALGVEFRPFVECAYYYCTATETYEVIFAENAGDSTVPTHVLEGGIPRGPNAETLAFADSEYTHAENVDNPRILACIMTVLAKGWCTPRTPSDPPPGPGPQLLATTRPDTRYLTVRGMQRIRLTDGDGLTADLDLTTGFRTGTSPIRIEKLGSQGAMLLLPSDEQASVELSAFPNGLAYVQATKGRNTITANQLIRFRDLAVPTGGTLQFTVQPDGIQQVQVDDTGDGTIDHTYAPDVSVSNTASVDIAPPDITIDRTVLANNLVSFTMSASDASGVARLLYSLDGTNYTPYTGPITVNAYDTPYVYAFADDTLTNRSPRYSRATRLLALNGPISVPESQGSLQIPVHMDLPGGQIVKVKYEIEAGSASADADFTPVTGVLELAPNQQDAQLTLPIIDDLLDEGDETLTISLSFPENAGFAQRTQQVTIVDNDAVPSVQFSATGFKADENSGAIKAQVTLSQPSSKDVTVSYATSDGTAVAPGDYVPASASVTIKAGATTAEISIAVNPDYTAWEPSETFGLRLTAATDASVGTPDSATLTITTNALAVRKQSPWENESAGTVNVPVMLADAQAVRVTVDYATQQESAKAGLDYETASGTLIFEPGDTTRYIPVKILEDGSAETQERLYIMLSNAVNGSVTSDSYGTILIRKNDHVEWSGFSPTQVAETPYNSPPEIRLYLTLDSPSAQEVTVEYSTADGLAVDGSDYESANRKTVTFQPFQTSANFAIPIIDDVLPEGDEDFTVQLNSALNAELVADTSRRITIFANDNEPTATPTLVPTVTPTPGPTNTPAPNGSVLFVIGTTTMNQNDSLVEARLRSLGFSVEVKHQSAATSADAAGKRLVVISSSVGSTAVNTKFTNVAVPVLTWEYALYDDLKLTGATSADFGQTSSATQLVITDPAHPLSAGLAGTVTVQNTAYAMPFGVPSAQAASVATAAGKTVLFGYEANAAMVGMNAPARRVGFWFADSSPVAADANTQGWPSFDAAVRWAAGIVATPPTATATATSVPPTATATATSVPPTATATATSVPPTATATASATATATSVPPVIAWSSTTTAVHENAGTALLTLQLSRAADAPVTVQYAGSHGTAGFQDYGVVGSGTVTFSPGQTSATVELWIVEDGTMEGDETFNVTLSAPTNATLSAAPTHTVTIRANDTLTINGGATGRIHENAGSAIFYAVLNAPSSQTVSVKYAVSAGTASTYSDFYSQGGTLTFAPGQTLVAFTVAIYEDSLQEGDETFTITLSAPTNAGLGSPSSQVVTIAANDSLTVSPATQSVHESAGSAIITVNLNAPSAQSVTVQYATSPGTALAGSDYGATSGTLTFSPGQTAKTVSIAILEDGTKENAENFTLALSNPTNAALGTPASATVSIAANDTLAFTELMMTRYEENTLVTVDVILNAPSAQTVTVLYGIKGGTATNGVDYIASGGTLTFSPGQTSRSFTFQIQADTITEGDETLQFSLSTATNAQVGSLSSLMVTITEDCSRIC